MRSFLVLLAVLATASALSSLESPSTYGNYSDLEHSEKTCNCKNGRCVTDNRGKTKCNCKSGYALQDEETCEECDCGTNGECFFSLQRNPDGQVFYRKECLCDKNYAPKDGICVECVCGENSKCEFENGEKNCYCIEGYAEKDGVCTECNCGENGECKFENGEKTCYCDEDYLVNNGICEECYCGDNGTCSFVNERKVCFCDAGYKEKEGICEVCNCGQFGLDCRYEEQEKICRCSDGYAQRLGICEECACGNNSLGCSFSNNLEKLCECRNGYVQRDGKCEVGCGVYRHCENGGQCDNGYCKCLPGTSGDFCEIIDGCRNLCPNREDITCAYDAVRHTAYCKCRQEELSYDPSTQKCKTGCSVDRPCENGGQCENGYCKCLPGTSGDYCEDIDGCRKLCPNKTDIICAYDVVRQRPYCKCVQEDRRLDSQTLKCKRTCDVVPCRNGGTCDKSGEYGFCRCPLGTSGELCEDSLNGLGNTTCTEFYCYEGRGCKYYDMCGAGATCSFDFTKLKASCICNDNQLSYDERTKTCRRLVCNRKCVGGVCNVVNGYEVCTCPQGYVLYTDGVCRRIPCQNRRCGGGVCNVVNGYEVCTCPPGFVLYTDDVCRRIPCQRRRCTGGSCSVINGYEVCSCPPGYVLHQDVCRRILCQRRKCTGGSCSVINGNEVCSCPPGHTLHQDVCWRILCQRRKCTGGSCSVINGYEVCYCPPGTTLYQDVCWRRSS